MLPRSLDRTPTPTTAKNENAITCTTFNILAPIYKRIGSEECRESQFHEVWFPRNKRILEKLLHDGSSIICLQEFWLVNDELVQLYVGSLENAGYKTFKLARTNNRGDGLLTAVDESRLRVLDYQPLPFYDCWDRVAQIFHLRLKVPFYKRNQTAGPELLLVNTHLLFPHDSSFCLARLRQVYKIIECLESFREKHGLSSVPVVLCGDWNGSKRGQVYKFLRSQGFESSYDTVHRYTDNDAHRWVSHRNHRGNICGVDFIWLRNPNANRKTLSASWTEAVCGIIKAKLNEIGKDARFFHENGAKLSRHDLGIRLQQLGVTKWCSDKEIEDLMQHLIFDLPDRAVEHKDIKTDNEQCPAISIPKFNWKGNSSGQQEVFVQSMVNDFTANQISDNNSGFDIEAAFLYPPEVEQGSWPEDYSLSDHAPLTAVFKPHS